MSATTRTTTVEERSIELTKDWTEQAEEAVKLADVHKLRELVGEACKHNALLSKGFDGTTVCTECTTTNRVTGARVAGGAKAMNKYRKRPVVIEAYQIPPKWWEGDTVPYGISELSIWLMAHAADWQYHESGGINITTLEGVMYAAPGDWIIRGIAGEFYPCKPRIFDATYEAVQ